MTTAAATRLRTRTVFISDIHLGTRGCQAELLLDFLDSIDTEILILVGDVVDLWSLRRRLYWPASHQAVLARFMQLAAAGTRVIYVPGNHDEEARAFCGLTLGRIDVQRELRVDKPAILARAVRQLGAPALRTAHIMDRLKRLVRSALAFARLAVFLDRKHCELLTNSIME